MKTLQTGSAPSQTPSTNGQHIELEEVIANAIAAEILTTQIFLQLHVCFAEQHEAAFAFAKMAGATAEHETEIQRRWSRFKMTPQAFVPINHGMRTRQRALLQELTDIKQRICVRFPTLHEAIQLCFQIIEEEEQVVDELIKSAGNPSMFSRGAVDGIPFYKNPAYKAALFALARKQGLIPCEWGDMNFISKS